MTERRGARTWSACSSIEEAARALGLGRSKIYELIAAGELETVHIGRAARVPVDALEVFITRLRQR
ncbi:MAG: helix-turn-helix domain-containing protein [Acidimicrobiia bacterium]